MVTNPPQAHSRGYHPALYILRTSVGVAGFGVSVLKSKPRDDHSRARRGDRARGRREEDAERIRRLIRVDHAETAYQVAGRDSGERRRGV
jgi:hypothetical protein